MGSHPWFQPLYRRALTLAFCLAWFGFEIWSGSGFWQVIAAAFSGYAIWDFFLSGNYSTSREE